MNKRIVLAITGISMILGASAGAFLNTSKQVEEVVEASIKRYPNGDKDTYYNGIDSSKSGDSLLNDLHSLNVDKRKSTVGYSSMGTSASGSYKYTDYDPATIKYESDGTPYGTSILSFYSGKSTTSFNREHVWPDSRGGGSVDNDIFMTRPTITAENSNRGNSSYVEGMCHSSNGWDPVTAFEKTMGVYPGIRGECARIIFYCAIANTNLKIVEGADTSYKNSIGDLDSLLRWNLSYSVNERERNRNEGGEHLQGNRNPFVDHPEYACKIWGNTNTSTKQICGSVKKTLSSIELGGSYKTYFDVGETFTYTGLTVTAYYADGSSKTVTPTSVSNPTMSTAGTKTVTVSYTEDGVTQSATYTITVTNGGAPVSHTTALSLDKTNATVSVGGTLTLKATLTPSDSVDGVSWSTSNSSVATVSNGVVTGVKAGSAVITATSNNIKATCNVTVKTASSGDSTTVDLDFRKSNATFTDKEGNTWTANSNCSSGSYLSVKQDGVVSSSTISVDTSETITGNVIVGTYGGSGPVTNVYAVNSKGETVTNVAVCTPANKNENTISFTLTFTDTSDSNIKICFASGNSFSGKYIRFYGASVTYSSYSSGGSKIEEVSLDKTTLSFDLYNDSSSKTLSLTVVADVGVDKTPTWVSDNESVATVNNGVVTPQGVGSAVISATVGDKVASCVVTVTNSAPVTVSVTGVSLDTNHLDLLVGGTDGILNETVLPTNATNQDVIWSSSNTSVATVEDGAIHAVANGTATITVKTVDGNFTAQCSVSVSTPSVIVPVTGVSLNLNEKTIDEGESFTLAATVAPSDATNKNVTWTSSDENVATVNNGVVSAISAGTTRISVTTVDGEYSASCEVTVNSITPPTPISEKVMTELVIDKLPDKTIYKIGEPFVQTGLEVSVNYLDGSSTKVTDFFIPNKPNSSIVGSQTVKVYYNEFGKNVVTSFDVLYIEETQTIDEIKLDGELLKTEYFVGDELLLYGFDVKATLSDGTVVDATDLVEITCDLSTPGIAVVTVSLDGVSSVTFNVTVKEGEPSAKDEAVDFTYEYLEKIPEEVDQVTKAEWLMLEHYFNTLDEDAQAILRNYVTEYGGVKAGAEDNLLEVLTSYDEVVLAKKSQGFSDFMGRNPQSHEQEKSGIKLLPIIVAGVEVIVLTAGLIILLLALTKKRRKVAK